MERSCTMRKKCLITFLTAVLLLGGLAGKSVLAEKKTSADPEAEVQGFEEFSYDTDDKMFLALCNAILKEYPNLYGDDKFDAAIPVPYVVYEQKIKDGRTRQWGTFASFNFNYNPETLLMEMVSCAYDRGAMLVKEKGGDYSVNWEPTYTDDDQAALERKYGVTETMNQLRYNNEDVDKKMAEILKGYCEYNGFRIIGYKEVNGTIHKLEE